MSSLHTADAQLGYRLAALAGRFAVAAVSMGEVCPAMLSWLPLSGAGRLAVGGVTSERQ